MTEQSLIQREYSQEGERQGRSWYSASSCAGFQHLGNDVGQQSFERFAAIATELGSGGLRCPGPNVAGELS